MKMLIRCAWIYLGLCIAIPFMLHSNAQVMVQQPQSYSFHSRIGGDWLIVQRHNLANDPDDWHPSFVSITSNYKPVSHKLPDGRWEIEFQSEIVRDLP